MMRLVEMRMSTEAARPRAAAKTAGWWSDFFASARALGARCWRGATFRVVSPRRKKILAVRESAALGDRRFVAVVECGRRRFLVGSSPGSVSLLARLPDGDENTGANT